MQLNAFQKLTIIYEYAQNLSTDDILNDRTKMAKILHYHNNSATNDLNIVRVAHVIASHSLDNFFDLKLKKRAFKKYCLENEALIHDVFDNTFIKLPHSERLTKELGAELKIKEEKEVLGKNLNTKTIKTVIIKNKVKL